MQRGTTPLSTLEKIGPWVLRLESKCTRVAVRENDADCGAVELPKPPGREGAIMELCAICEGIAGAMGQSVTLTLYGQSSRGTDLVRLRVRVMPPVEVDSAMPDDPENESLVRVLTKHTHALTKTVVDNAAGIVAVHRESLKAINEVVTSLRNEVSKLRVELDTAHATIRDLEKDLKNACDAADEAIKTGETQGVRQHVEAQLGDAIGTLMRGKLGELMPGLLPPQAAQAVEAAHGTVVPAPTNGAGAP